MDPLPNAEDYAIWVPKGPWRIVGRPRYLADRRATIEADWDREFGVGEWLVGYA